MVSEQERQMVENEEDDEELLSMLAEGLGNRTSLLDVHLDRAREAVAAAEQEESEAQRALTHAKEQVSCSLAYKAVVERCLWIAVFVCTLGLSCG